MPNNNNKKKNAPNPSRKGGSVSRKTPRGKSVNAPSATGGHITLQSRTMTPTKDGVRVHFTDRIDNLITDGVATSKGFVSIGGSFSYFPWLARIATSYSRFRVNYMRYFVASSCPTTTTGMATVAYLPESTDVVNWQAASEDQAIFQMSKSVSAPLWSGTGIPRDNPLSITLTSNEIHNMSKWLYTGAGVTISDYNTHYAGALVIQTSPVGGAAGIQIKGQVFIEYDIDFVQPTAHLFNSFQVTNTERFPEGGYKLVYPPQPSFPKPDPPKPEDQEPLLGKQ